ncbi:hypothetical protein D3C87_2027120 [compost metagenome]
MPRRPAPRYEQQSVWQMFFEVRIVFSFWIDANRKMLRTIGNLQQQLELPVKQTKYCPA